MWRVHTQSTASFGTTTRGGAPNDVVVLERAVVDVDPTVDVVVDGTVAVIVEVAVVEVAVVGLVGGALVLVLEVAVVAGDEPDDVESLPQALPISATVSAPTNDQRTSIGK